MNLQQIQNLTLEQCYYDLLLRLFPEGVPPFSLDEQEENFYNKLTFENSELKPTLEQMENQLSLYKAELQAAEEARLAEIARREAMQARLDAIKDSAMACYKLGLVQDGFNFALIAKDIIDSNNETLLAQIEAKDAEFQAELLAQNQVDAMTELRKARDLMLSKTDFTQLADAPLTSEEKAEYRGYRAFLRSLPTLIEQSRYFVEQGVISFEEWQANKAQYNLV